MLNNGILHVLTRVKGIYIMKLSELIKLLKDKGVEFLSHGKKHDRYINRATGTIIIVPRHAKEIPKGTAEKILKDAGIKR